MPHKFGEKSDGNKHCNKNAKVLKFDLKTSNRQPEAETDFQNQSIKPRVLLLLLLFF
jgi:hypothetical protein